MKVTAIQWLNPTRWYQRLTHFTLAEWKSAGLKLLSLLLAFILFLISRQPFSDMRLVGVPVEFTGLQQGMEIVGDENVTPTVSVRLRGPRDVVRGLLPNQLAVTANLSNKEPGERVVQLKPQNVLVPDGIEVMQIEPANIRLQLEHTSQKMVQVEPQFLGTPPDNFEIYQVQIEPPLLGIEGPQSYLANLTQVKTESINLREQRHSFKTTLDVELPQPSLRVINRASVTLTVELGERRTSRTLNDLPIQMMGASGSLRASTKVVSVTLFGPQSVVENLHANDVRVEANLAELPVNSDTLPVRLRLPGNLTKQVEIKSLNPSSITIKR